MYMYEEILIFKCFLQTSQKGRDVRSFLKINLSHFRLFFLETNKVTKYTKMMILPLTLINKLEQVKCQF